MKKQLLILCLLPLVGLAQIPDPKPNTYVNDYANVIPDEQETILNQRIRKLEDSTSVQLAIILIDKLPDNMAIEDYAREIGRRWHVGGNRENGIVYVVDVSEHKHRIEVAKRLEGDLPDVVCLEILQTAKGYYKQKDYFMGVSSIIDDINQRLNPVRKEQLRLAAIADNKEQAQQWESFKEGLGTFFLWALIMGLSYIVLYLFCLKDYWERKRAIKKRLERINSLPRFVEQDRLRRVSSKIPKTKNDWASPTKDTYIAPIIIPPSSNYNNSSDESYNNGSSSSSDFSSWGNWGGSSSDSGFSGGGADSNW